ncbi:unnamed protein product [Linum tenue]|uniref:CN hydrolase domain-containing protein n=1 Tax=Linum tenue TaxID=586396 RepID=A0AAV0PCX3_9ROSI|nr:unnamed protein product [Linum tenue]
MSTQEEQVPAGEPSSEPRRRKKRSGDPAAVPEGDRPYKRIHIPEFCLPAIAYLKRDLGFVNDLQIIPWLLEQIRFPPCETPASGNFVPRPMSPPGGGGSSAGQRLSVRVTVVQASTVVFDTPSTLVKAEQLINLAASKGSQLIVFPEAFVGGYPRFLFSDDSGTKEVPFGDDDRLKYRASAVDLSGPEVERLSQMAAKYQVNMVMGVVERSGTNLYSTVIFWDSQGKLQGSHRKSTILHSESPLWSPASSSLVLPLYATSSAGRIGGLISSDNRLPLLRSMLYERGIQIYCAPTADATKVWKASMTHIAVEGSCFVLSANQFCRQSDYHRYCVEEEEEEKDDAVVSPGGSVIVSPRGEIMEGPRYHGEYVLSTDLGMYVIIHFGNYLNDH